MTAKGYRGNFWGAETILCHNCEFFTPLLAFKKIKNTTFHSVLAFAGIVGVTDVTTLSFVLGVSCKHTAASAFELLIAL
jgi:hypothetical protein